MAKLEGLPVVDAVRGLELHVERRDVDRKARKNPAQCALATCATRMYKTECRVYMSRAYVKSADGLSWTRYTVGGTTQREITAFDRGAPFEPGIYRLSPPAPSTRLGNGSKIGGNGQRTGKGPKPRHISLNVRQRAPVGGIQK